MMMNNHYFHLVNPSPWPLLMSMNMLNTGVMLVKWLTSYSLNSLIYFSFINVLILIQWWRDVVRESIYEGSRSTKINYAISMGMIMFIISEICFFTSFFWTYFYFSLNPDFSLGSSWPPFKMIPVSFMDIPLLNTLTLLASGFFITWSHHSIMNSEFENSKLSMVASIVMGIYFVIIQSYEYLNSWFSFNDSVFGSSFFILTGFHGMHVIVGLIFIITSYLRFLKNNFSSYYFHGLEYSIWYWHFVDLVWLFLYVFVYWWGM